MPFLPISFIRSCCGCWTKFRDERCVCVCVCAATRVRLRNLGTAALNAHSVYQFGSVGFKITVKNKITANMHRETCLFNSYKDIETYVKTSDSGCNLTNYRRDNETAPRRRRRSQNERYIGIQSALKSLAGVPTSIRDCNFMMGAWSKLGLWSNMTRERL